ncbi:MAG: hypothetical protein KAS23_02595 [Anaerohalosphaera sp.]|nr:hypothetical protein [Anaerohalosphaera sp.]
MKKGHTIVELLVAMGLLAAIMLASGTVFQQAIGAHRTAKATSQVSQKLRTVTQQLDSDFKGLRKDAPFAVYFTQSGGDQIMFFADGDFQGYGIPDRSNLARIYYGAANVFGVRPKPTLARRQHIYLPVASELFPDISDLAGSLAANNNVAEYDTLTLSQWKSICGYTVNNDIIVSNIFSLGGIDGRAVIDTESLTDAGVSSLMCQGVSNFKVQFANPVGGSLMWWPQDFDYIDNNDPLFPFPAPNELGFSANMAGGVTNWRFGAVPNALKFTFTLHDDAGVFVDGKTFTHIVYLNN